MMVLRIIITIILLIPYGFLWRARYKAGGLKKAGLGNFLGMVFFSILIVAIWAPVFG